ncbi:MAG: DUF11 domain-containing protein [Pirellulaceae bacterium]|nr:DUF11 domain-containing protein [Pirellulaceae bacterium]
MLLEPLEDRRLLAITNLAAIEGTLFYHVPDAPRVPVPGEIIRLYEDDGDGVFDSGIDSLEATDVTDANGKYRFDGLSAGKYFVVQPPDLSGTIDPPPAPLVVTVDITPTDAAGVEGVQIDDFATEQLLTAQLPPEGTPLVSSSVAASDAVKGHRQVIVQAVSGTGTANVAIDANANGLFSYSESPATRGNATVFWDGVAGDHTTVNPIGLGGVDLTGDGIQDSFVLNIPTSDIPASQTLIVYSSETNASQIQIPVPFLAEDLQQVVEFSDFVPLPGFGPADFTDVGAIVFKISKDPSPSLDIFGLDYQLEYIRTVGPTVLKVDLPYDLGASLGDFVWIDVNGNGIQNAGEPDLNGVTVNLLDSVGSVINTTVTANNGGGSPGYYQFTHLAPGTYSVQFVLPGGYVFTPQNADGLGVNGPVNSDASPLTGITPSVTLVSGQTNLNVDAGLYQPASLGDFVWIDQNGNGIQNAGEPGLNGVTVNLLDSGGSVIGTTVTANNGGGSPGYYRFTGLAPGTYSVQFVLPNDFEFSPQNADGLGVNGPVNSDANPVTGVTPQVTLVSGQTNLNVDAGLYQPASLGDFVWIDSNGNGIQNAGEPGLNGLTVNLLNAGGSVIGTTVTANNGGGSPGYYQFTGLAPGTYSVQFVLPGGYAFTPQNADGLGVNGPVNSDANPVTGVTPQVTLVSGQTNLNVDAGLYQPASLGDFVWIDQNGNGIQNAGEPGLNGVTVNLLNAGGSVIGTTVTANNGGGSPGYYQFTGLAPGTYSVQFVLPSGYAFTPQNADGLGVNGPVNSDANPVTGVTPQVTLVSGQTNLNVDAGLYQPASLGDFVWIDLNGNGIQNAGEPGLNGVTVNLLNAGGSVIGTTVTANNGGGSPGYYQFTGLAPGTYSVQFVLPGGYAFTPQNADGLGVNGPVNSDANPATGVTPQVTLVSGQTNLNVDAGLYQPASLGDFVWIDQNGNGIQNAGEPGRNGVTVNLLNAGGGVIGTTVTANNGSGNPGYYQFTGLAPGTYSVQFVLPNDFEFSPQNADGLGVNGPVNSDANPVTGATPSVTLVSGTNNPNLDAGLLQGTDLGITKIDCVTSVGAGYDTIYEYEITVTNHGPSLAENVIVTDTWPDFLTRISLVYSVGTVNELPGGDFEWLIGDLDVGESVELRFEYVVDAGASGEITNTATVVSDTLDSNQLNNTASDTNTVGTLFIHGTAFIDSNGNNRLDPSEGYKPDAPIYLYYQGCDGLWVLIAETTTDANGYYLFENLAPGNYRVVEGDVTHLGYTQGGTQIRSDVYEAWQLDPATIQIELIEPLTARLASFSAIQFVNVNRFGVALNSIRAGQLQMRLSNDGGATFGPSFYSFCIDLYHGLISAGDTYDVVAETAPRFPGLEQNIGRIGFLFNQFGTAALGATNAAALNLALWELVYDVTPNLTAGNFRASASSATMSWANYYLNVSAGKYEAVVFLNVDDPSVDPTDPIENSRRQGVVAQTSYNFANVPAPSTVALGDFVWVDRNGNGIQDAGESGLNGVTVRLLDAGGNVVGTTVTANNTGGNPGYYSFTGRPPGTYSVEFVLPGGYAFSPQDADGQGINGPFNSDADPATGRTGQVTLAAGQTNLNLDAGLYRPAALGDFVWVDLNADGIQNVGEPGLNGVTVQLLDAGGSVIDTTVTANNGGGSPGYYLFAGLSPGTYSVQFVLPSGYTFSPQNADGNGVNGIFNSDANPLTGTTPSVTLVSGQTNLNVDAGLVRDAVEDANLGITKIDCVTSIGAGYGTIYEYSIVVTNHGPSPAEDVAVLDTWPDFLTRTGLSSSVGAVNELPGGDFEWLIGNLAAGESVELTVTYTVDADASGEITNTATVVSSTPDSDLSNNTASDTNTVGTLFIQGTAFVDENGNNQLDPDEGYKPDAPIYLYYQGCDGLWVLIAETHTDENGYYIFENLAPGNYRVVEGDVSHLGYVASGTQILSDVYEASQLNPSTIQIELNEPLLATLLIFSSVQLVDVERFGVDLGFIHAGQLLFEVSDDGGATFGEPFLTFCIDLYHDLLTPELPFDVVAELAPRFPGLEQNVGRIGFLFNQFGTAPLTAANAAGMNLALWELVYDVTPDLSAGNFRASGGTDAMNWANYYLGVSAGKHEAVLFLNVPDVIVNPAIPIKMTRNQGILAQGSFNFGNVPVTSPARLGDFVWRDANGNGIQDAGEPGLNGVTVNLLDSGGSVIDTTVTANNVGGVPGYYQFTDLAPGTYSVQFVLPSGYVFSPQNADGLGVNGPVNSDADTVTGVTPSVTLVSGENNPNLDAGLYQPASLGDFVWIDLNGNGIQNAGEPGLNGVTVNLLSAGGSVIDTTVTANNGGGNPGYYRFTDLVPGTYSVQFVLPSGYVFSPQNADGLGVNGSVNSDANPVTGITPMVTLVSGQTNLNVDAGLVREVADADLAIAKTDCVDSVGAGHATTYEYTITVTNHGPAPAVGVRVLDIWPDFLTRTGLSPSVGAVNELPGGDFEWLIGNLAAGASVELTVTYTVDAGASGDITNTVTVASDSPDPNPLNNTASDTNTVGMLFIHGTAFIDGNGNSMLDANEAYKPDAPIYLYYQDCDGNWQLIGETTTDENGYYIFENLAPGNYRVVEGDVSFLGYMSSGTQIRSNVYDAFPLNTSTIQVELVEPLVARLSSFAAIQTVNLNRFGVPLTNARAGQLRVQVSDNGGVSFGPLFNAFCIDLYHALISPGDTYAVVAENTPRFPGLEQNVGRIGFLYNQFGTVPLSATNAAALNLALWELVYDATPNLTVGNFRASASPATISWANYYLNVSAGKFEAVMFLNVPDPVVNPTDPMENSRSQGILSQTSFNFANVPVPGIQGFSERFAEDFNTLTGTSLDFVEQTLVLPGGRGTNKVEVSFQGDDLVVMSGRTQLLRQPWAELNRLTIVGADNKADAITLNLGKGGILPPLEIVVDGGIGSQTDTLTILGTAGDDVLSVERDRVLVNGPLVVSFQNVRQVAVDGGAGNDTYAFTAMPDSLSITDKHKTSIDTLDFSGADRGVIVDLNSTRAQQVLGGQLTLKSKLEDLIGTPLADKLYGNSLANRIWGGDGDDWIDGRGGNDWLYGEGDDDTLVGGSGNDILIGGAGHDTLIGTSGKNLLIGGSGSDDLQGGSSEDILVARSTGYEANDAALMDIMRQWTARGSVAVRTTALRSSYFSAESLGTAGAGDIHSPVNQLRGGRGADWFLRFDDDIVFDLEKTDIDELLRV